MLENTLTTDFIPGTNLTGGLARASWRFLLPTLELDQIVCLGIPSKATLDVLSSMGKTTLAVSTDSRELDQIQRDIESWKNDNLRILRVNAWNHLPLADKSVALVFFAGRKELTQLFRDASFAAEVGRLMNVNGALYFEVKKRSEQIAARKLMQRFANLGFAAPRVLWLTPLTGELRTAFPLDDDRMSQYLFTNVLYGQSAKMRAISRAGILLSRAGLLRHAAPRRAILMQRSSTDSERQTPPHYMVALAKKSGMDLSGMRCGLSARGKFNANKNIFYLFDRQSEKARVVVKMTRAAEFNPRLENEYRVLTALHEKSFVERDTFPAPLFFGYHANLAMLGQIAVHGEPFRRRTKATIDCSIAHDAINWIVKLGIASANAFTASSAEVETALMKLFQRFAEIYPLSKFEADFLEAQIAVIGKASKKFPLVFQHGDPGTWNMLVSETNRVIVIDWEAGEPEGMPLWDLFYFMRTYGSWMSRRHGNKEALQNFTQNFLEPSPLRELLAATLSRYSAGVGLHADLIAPLFYTCWMHRSLKEATRLPKDALANGTFFTLLRRCIERHNAPALAALFSPSRT